MAKRTHIEDIAHGIVKDLRNQWGGGWEQITPAMREAFANQRAFAVVCGWHISEDTTAENIIDQATDLRRAVGVLTNPADWVVDLGPML